MSAKAVRSMDEMERLLACLQSFGDSQGPQKESYDIHVALEQRRNELMIAGELGKALLEKSNSLSQQNEKITREFSGEAERLLQENHKLRQRLGGVEEELRTAQKDYEKETADLATRLVASQQATSASERDRSRLADQLSQQNERLSADLLAIRKNEYLLQQEATHLRANMRQKRNVVNELSAQVDLLNDENKTLRLTCLQVEADSRDAANESRELTAACRHLQQTVVLLEKQSQSLTEQLESAVSRLSELQERVAILQAELDGDGCLGTDELTHSAANYSLLEELEMSQRSLTSGYESSQSVCDDSEGEDGSRVLSSVHLLLPLDAYGQLQLEVCDSIEVLKQAVKEAAAVLGQSPSSFSCSSEDLSPGCELIYMARQVKRYVTSMTSALSESAPLETSETKSLLQNSKGDELNTLLGELEKDRADLAATAELLEVDLAARLREERDEGMARSEDAVKELLRAKCELMGRENELLETTQANKQLARHVDLWKRDMADVISTRVSEQLQREASTVKVKTTKRSVWSLLWGH